MYKVDCEYNTHDTQGHRFQDACSTAYTSVVSSGLQHAASTVGCEAVAPTKEGANQSPLEGAKISKARTLRSPSLSQSRHVEG